jgi:hypothetical protein
VSLHRLVQTVLWSDPRDGGWADSVLPLPCAPPLLRSGTVVPYKPRPRRLTPRLADCLPCQPTSAEPLSEGCGCLVQTDTFSQEHVLPAWSSFMFPADGVTCRPIGICMPPDSFATTGGAPAAPTGRCGAVSCRAQDRTLRPVTAVPRYGHNTASHKPAGRCEHLPGLMLRVSRLPT